MAAGVIDVGQQLLGVGHFQQDGICGRQGDGVEVCGIKWGGHNGRVARPDQRQAQMAEPFLGTEAGEHFPLGIEVYAVVFEVFGRHFPPQAEDAHGLAIAVVFGVSGGLGQLVDYQVLGWIGGVAHAQVDHVVAGATFLVHQAIDLGEQVGGRRRTRSATSIEKGRFCGTGSPVRGASLILGARQLWLGESLRIPQFFGPGKPLETGRRIG